VIGRAPYGHGAVVRSILARERGGPGQPGGAPGSIGAPSLAGSLGAAHDPQTFDGESDGGPLACPTITLEHSAATG
jgi:hypothetical protein